MDVSYLKKWVKSVDMLKALATSFSDDVVLEELNAPMDMMNSVFKALTGADNLTKGL